VQSEVGRAGVAVHNQFLAGGDDERRDAREMDAQFAVQWLRGREVELRRMGILPVITVSHDPPQPDRSSPMLAVCLLGAIHVELNATPIVAWPSQRMRALFQYLVTHRNPWPRREVLMEAFWPRMQPASARNNLNVAIHGIRRIFRAVADHPVVVFEDGVYRLHRSLRLWLDVEDFEYHVQVGRALHGSGDLASAEVEYVRAARLYRGDFAIDDPYADWPAVYRERLLLAYLDTLDRLSELYVDQRHYASSATLCQRILERDPCWERAHRRLMLCYGLLGHYHLAFRQYGSCERALRNDIGVEPGPATKELLQRLRDHRV